MKMNKGAISIFALLSMMFFLIFIMVAYNNVTQKGKMQVETQEILVKYYKSTLTASEIYSARDGATNASNGALRDADQKSKLTGNSGKYIYSNGKIYYLP